MTKKIKGIVPGPRPKNPATVLDSSWVSEAAPVPVTNLPYFGIVDWSETDAGDR